MFRNETEEKLRVSRPFEEWKEAMSNLRRAVNIKYRQNIEKGSNLTWNIRGKRQSIRGEKPIRPSIVYSISGGCTGGKFSHMGRVLHTGADETILQSKHLRGKNVLKMIQNA